MGLDIYVGPLCRYYTGAWETVVQRYGRETGTSVYIVRATPASDDAITDPRLAVAFLENWRSSLGRAAASQGVTLD